MGYGLPFLAPTEFVRAKLRAWTIAGSSRDANDAAAVLVRCVDRIDPRRIEQGELRALCSANEDVAIVWAEVRKRHRRRDS